MQQMILLLSEKACQIVDCVALLLEILAALLLRILLCFVSGISAAKPEGLSLSPHMVGLQTSPSKTTKGH